MRIERIALVSTHPTAIVDPSAKIGADVDIGAFTIVHGNVEIGDRTVIGSHCEIGHPTALADGSPLRIRPRSLIRSHSIFYEGSSFGPELTTGHRVTVREGTRAGAHARIGTLVDIMGECTIGDYSRLLNNCHIGQYSTIGNFVWIFPFVCLTNDPTPPSNNLFGCTIEDYAILATNGVIMPGVRVGEGAVIGAGSVVSRDVGAHRIAIGQPATDRGPTSRIKLRDGSGSAYLWTRHFHRGFPEEVVTAWMHEVNNLTSSSPLMRRERSGHQ